MSISDFSDSGTSFYDKIQMCPKGPGIAGTGVVSPAGILETDPNGRDLNSPGAKADAGKQLPWLVLGDFAHALEQVVQVGTLGAHKYTKSGWITVPEGKERYMEAFGRHLLALGKGIVYDNGPNGIGTKHLAQMIWNLLAVLELEEREESISKT